MRITTSSNRDARVWRIITVICLSVAAILASMMPAYAASSDSTVAPAQGCGEWWLYSGCPGGPPSTFPDVWATHGVEMMSATDQSTGIRYVDKGSSLACTATVTPTGAMKPETNAMCILWSDPAKPGQRAIAGWVSTSALTTKKPSLTGPQPPSEPVKTPTPPTFQQLIVAAGPIDARYMTFVPGSPYFGKILTNVTATLDVGTTVNCTFNAEISGEIPCETAGSPAHIGWFTRTQLRARS